MSTKNLTPLNGFDEEDLNNAKQNNYAWSIGELKDYIYVGTGKNMLLWIVNSFVERFQDFKMPIAIDVNDYNNTAEIWRYKKDNTRKWELVYKAQEGIEGIRYIISVKLNNCKNALLAVGSSNSKKNSVKILMTYDGIIWREVQSKNIKGTTSRTMEVYNDTIYLATTVDNGEESYLYSSTNPEVYGWKTLLDSSVKNFDSSKNPKGSIYNIKFFNNHLYVSTSDKNGVQLWRTEGSEPEINKWVLIADNGFGDRSNSWSLSMGTFKEHLYVSVSKQLPKAYLNPKGADLIRVDKNDNWEIVVGGEPEEPVECSVGVRRKAVSSYESGFSNPLNVYIWQICEYKDSLYLTTFDHGSNLQTVLEILLLNKKILSTVIASLGIKEKSIEELIGIYKNTLKKLDKEKYQYGFDIFKSKDGINFSPLVLNGLGNNNNYGGRILFVSSENKLYIGTANPYEGCEVWESDNPLEILRGFNCKK